MELRKAGFSYTQIGNEIGITASTACKHVTAQLRMLSEKCTEEAREVIKLELERLDSLLVGLWQAARHGEVEKVDRVLKIMNRRAHLLGLDAPKKLEHSGDPEKPMQSQHGLTPETASFIRSQVLGVKPEEGK